MILFASSRLRNQFSFSINKNPSPLGEGGSSLKFMCIKMRRDRKSEFLESPQDFEDMENFQHLQEAR